MDQYFSPDIKFITDEKFDFGLSSPSDSQSVSEEEELRHVDRGVAQRLDLNVQQREGARECLARWSPLSPEKLEEIVKEANRLAVQLERCSLQEKENASSGRASPRSPRRETFVVKNSPVRALLPTVEPGTPLPMGKSPSPSAGPSSDWGLRGWQSPQGTVSGGGSKGAPHPRKGGMGGSLGTCLNSALMAPAFLSAPSGRAKASRDDAPQLPASAGPTHSAHAHQTQATSTAAPVPTSRRLMPSGIPKPASRSVVLSRAAVSGRPSQPQPMGHGSAGRRVLPSAAGQRGESLEGASRACHSPQDWELGQTRGELPCPARAGLGLGQDSALAGGQGSPSLGN
uniref:Proline and serine rich coiled-coil 1 n=1 Tax=Chrysemys picta bellii TaxID=8478 RepID=A0A8C3FYP3_CHRPI